jgi:hypothetical protein
MHHHLGLQLGSTVDAPPSPPSTQESSSIVSGQSVQTSTPASRPSAPVSRSAASAPQPTQVRPSQHLTQHSAPQAARPLAAAAAPNLHAPTPAPPITNPAPQVAGNATAQPSSAVEIAALRARIAELENGNAHGNHLPARAPVPHQALVADPTAVDRVRASLSNSKDESKRPTLPALQPGHKVSALSLCKSCSHLFLCHPPCSFVARCICKISPSFRYRFVVDRYRTVSLWALIVVRLNLS